MQDLMSLLKDKHVNIREIKYSRPLLTSKDVANEEGITLSQVVKTMVVQKENIPYLVLLPGNVQLDLAILNKICGGSYELMPAVRIQDTIGCQVGAITPIISLEKDIPCILDRRIMDEEEISISSGNPLIGIRLAPEELLKILPNYNIIELTDATVKKTDIIIPRILKGFRDYLPEEMVLRQSMIKKVTSIFELFGFIPLQTPAIEYSDILLGKYGPEAEKLLYRFKDNGGRDVCLRYDLTVPLARVIAQYPEIPKPFKRYQVAPVWRAEKPGRGRFREFFQCDADIIGTSSMVADAECISLDYNIMNAIGVPNFKIRINNRKILNALGNVLQVKDNQQKLTIFRTIDKLPSQGSEIVQKLLTTEAGCTHEQIKTIFDFLQITGDNHDRLTAIKDILEASSIGAEAISELKDVIMHAVSMGVPESCIVIDFSIARGLDYYTGTVYETFLEDIPSYGSVMSGGRYDTLISRFLGKEIPAVGISVGVDRLFDALKELKIFNEEFITTKIFIVVLNKSYLPYGLEIVTQLRRERIPCEIIFEGDLSLKKQLKIANAKKIPYTIIIGPDELKSSKLTIKNMMTGKQEKLSITEIINEHKK